MNPQNGYLLYLRHFAQNRRFCRTCSVLLKIADLLCPFKVVQHHMTLHHLLPIHLPKCNRFCMENNTNCALTCAEMPRLSSFAMTKAANFLLQEGDIFEKFEAYLGIVTSLLYYIYNMSMLFTEDCSVRFSVVMFDNVRVCKKTRAGPSPARMSRAWI